MLDLSGHHRKHFWVDSVKLIETAPKPGLRKTRKILPHGLRIEIFPAIRHYAPSSHRLSQILTSLSLSSPGRASRRPAQTKRQSSSKSHHTPISKRSNNQSAIKPLILVPIVENPSALSNDYVLLLQRPVEPQLTLPVEFSLVQNRVSYESVYDVSLVHFYYYESVDFLP